MNTIPTSIRLPADLRRVFRKQARKEHRSISSLIIYVLDCHAIANKLFEAHPAARGKLRRRTSEEVDRAEEKDARDG
jgi:hypothetical protein